MTWDQASSMCQMGSNSALLEITSEMQMEFIQMEMGTGADDHPPPYYSWWIAGTDVGINGQWFWIASRTDVEDFVWASGFPNSKADDNCMCLTRDSSHLGENL